MKEQTRYRYEQRIKSLEQELCEARGARDTYRRVLSELWDYFVQPPIQNNIDISYVLKKFRSLWRYP